MLMCFGETTISTHINRSFMRFFNCIVFINAVYELLIDF